MAADELFTMTIDDMFYIDGRDPIATGVVETGTVSVGDRVIVVTGNGAVVTKVRGLERMRERLRSASIGEAVGIELESVHKDEVTVGDRISATG